MRFFKEYSEFETKFEYAAPILRPDQFELSHKQTGGDLYQENLMDDTNPDVLLEKTLKRYIPLNFSSKDSFQNKFC